MNTVPQSEKNWKEKISRLESEIVKLKRDNEENRQKWESEKRRLEEQISVLRYQKNRMERENQQLKHGKQT